jgi:hypothetical protein
MKVLYQERGTIMCTMSGKYARELQKFFVIERKKRKESGSGDLLAMYCRYFRKVGTSICGDERKYSKERKVRKTNKQRKMARYSVIV